MEKGMLYAAYGSNLDLGQMSCRCPNARVAGVGRIEGYQLAFKALGSCSFATIEPCTGSSVPVLLWYLGVSDELRLDRYEGFPTHYDKEIVGVRVGKEQISAMAYIMNPKAHPAAPSREYYEILYKGYERFGFDISKLVKALAVSEGKGVSNSLKLYRIKEGLTQRELAKASGVSLGLIQKYETGERNLGKSRVDIVYRLSFALHVPIQNLICFEQTALDEYK